MYPDHFLNKRLDERIANNSLRKLSIADNCADFSSNDYLGIKTNGLVDAQIEPGLAHGSGGARTLTGNYALIEETESMLCRFHQAEAALIFNSGYCANLGITSSIPQRGDTILYDQLSHASLRDGVRLSKAESLSFRHNDLDDLEVKLKNAKGNVFVVTESVFSMDGDIVDLKELVTVCEKYGAHIIIDEAHATGVVGERGEGVVQHKDLSKKIFARTHTFGKALGVHGAVVVGSGRLKSYLLNFARSFVFTTALPESAVKAIMASYNLFPGMREERVKLRALIQRFNAAEFSFYKLRSETPIQGIIIPGNDEVKAVALFLQNKKLDVRPILYPTVPKGKERLRINLHSFNTIDEFDLLISMLKDCEEKIEIGG